MPYLLITHLQRLQKRMPCQRNSGRRRVKRSYDRRRWRDRLSVIVLRRDPICVVPGCNEPSTDADHIVPKSQGGDDSMENLQGMCHAHHSRKTRQENQS